MAGEPVEPFGEVYEQVQLRRLLHRLRYLRELRFLVERFPELAGVEPPHLFRDRGDFRVVETEGEASVTDGTAGPVPVDHPHQRDPAAAEVVEQPPVHVVLPGGFDVEVDVGEVLPLGGEEPFPDEVVADRFDGGGAERVVEDGPDAGPARLDADAHFPDGVRDFGDGEEVRCEPELLDGLHLMFELRVRSLEEWVAGVEVVDAGAAAAPQFDERVAFDTDDASFRHPGRPRPTSLSGSRAHRSASATVSSGDGRARRVRGLRRRRPCSRPAASPSSGFSHACPFVWTRSSSASGVRVRAESAMSAVTASSGVPYRTALVRTAGRTAYSARASILVAGVTLPGMPGFREVADDFDGDRTGVASPGSMRSVWRERR